MDNTLPSSQQRPTQQPAAQPSVQPASASTPDVKVDDKIEEKSQQISAPNKEFGPMMSASPSEQGGSDDDEDEVKVAKQEIMLGQKVAPSKEVPLSDELKEAGVEQGEDTEQEIPTVVQRAGMRVTDNNDVIPISAIPVVKLPINYQHAKQLDKRSKIKDSIKWLARFIERQWEKMKAAEKNPKQEL